MVDLTLDRIVNLSVDWTDDSRASQESREIIEDEQTPTEDIETYLHEAMQGLVNQRLISSQITGRDILTWSQQMISRSCSNIVVRAVGVVLGVLHMCKKLNWIDIFS